MASSDPRLAVKTELTAKSHRNLQGVQRWMQAVIVDPDGVHSGAASDEARDAIQSDSVSIEDMILPSKALSSQRRMEVYANAYYARLLECLRDEYPALTSLLGEETFNAFAFEYLQTHPSRSYTLADLGHSFPAFLESNRAAGCADDDANTFGTEEDTSTDQSWGDLMIDLARVERTYSEVFSGPGIEQTTTLQAGEIAAVPADEVGSIRLRVAPCVRLLKLNTRAHEFAIATRKGTASTDQLPESVPTYLVITRLNYVVRTIVVEQEEFQLLQLLVSGKALGDSIAEVAEQLSLEESEWLVRMASWFQKWATDRIFEGFQAV